MKKKIISVVLSFMLLQLTSSLAFADDNVTVNLNGQTLNFDVQPQIINGSTMVPMRTIFESLGATVAWDQETQTITSQKGDRTIRLTIGVPSISINQYVPRELDAAPCIVNDRTLVPVRAISEAFYMNVVWDSTTRTVFITPPNVNIPKYNALKNAIITRGEKDNSSYLNGNDVYTIFYRNKNKTYSMLITYMNTKSDNGSTHEDISLHLSCSFESSGSKDSMTIFLYDYANPSFIYTYEFSDGSEYQVSAKFPHAESKFVETKNTFPEELKDSLYNLINSEFSLMDALLQAKTNVSFNDLGIYYIDY